MVMDVGVHGCSSTAAQCKVIDYVMYYMYGGDLALSCVYLEEVVIKFHICVWKMSCIVLKIRASECLQPHDLGISTRQAYYYALDNKYIHFMYHFCDISCMLSV